MNKRNRVYSLERNKLLGVAFARKYASYLAPALKKIEKQSSSSCKQNGELNMPELVRFEVDTAMAMSAGEEFAWSRSLKAQLQLRNDVTSNVAVGGGLQHLELKTTGIVEEKVSHDEGRRIATLLPPACSNAIMMEKPKKCYYSSKQNSTSGGLIQVPEGRRSSSSSSTNSKNEGNDENEEENYVKSRLAHLRKLLPGGNEMSDVELLTEVAGYITCLELQVNILDCFCGN